MNDKTFFQGQPERRVNASSAIAEFQAAMESHMQGFHRELELHTSNNDRKMQTLVDGQVRTDENLGKIREDQVRISTRLDGVQTTMDKMEKRQEENSGEIRELSAESKASKSQRSDLYEKVGKLQVKTGSPVAASAVKRESLLSSRYIQGSIAIIMVLVVIGAFRMINIDVATDASNLIKPSVLGK